ncbi:MAG: hypothetical protein AAGF95_05315 [Chloroflexota bacterium]
MNITQSALWLEIVTFGLALWLGFYLLSRNPAKLALRFTSFGLIAYALGLAFNLLSQLAPPAIASLYVRLQWFFLLLPGLCWSTAIISLLPEQLSFRERLVRAWTRGVFPLTTLCCIAVIATGAVFDSSTILTSTGWRYLLLVFVVIVPMVVSVVLLAVALRMVRFQRTFSLLLFAVILSCTSTGLLILPFDWLPQAWLILLLGGDLVFLGVTIAVLDAFDEGETLLPHFIRSLDAALLIAVIFGSQVVFVMALSTGVTLPMATLLLSTITAAIAFSTFADQFQSLLDIFAFASMPRLRRQRAELRAVANALPRVDEATDLHSLDDSEFVRLTRRAFSHFGDLAHLAGSPLTHLPIVEDRLVARNAAGDGIERAIELKTLLTESVDRLKPRNKGHFGTSDEWRYYNALYFPYVVGLKPYSRRATHDGLDQATREVLMWFQQSVPERTLYNWQNAAAKLIAHDLKAQLRYDKSKQPS